MVKNIILCIFMYILCVGCESTLTCEDCYLEISAPDLEMDENGYYHIEFLSNYVQTFTTLDAETGLKYEKVGWITDKKYQITTLGYVEETYLVNQASYADDGGVAHTVLGVWEEFIGDTIKVYCGYTNKCNIQYIDSLEVIVE